MYRPQGPRVSEISQSQKRQHRVYPRQDIKVVEVESGIGVTTMKAYIQVVKEYDKIH